MATAEHFILLQMHAMKENNITIEDSKLAKFKNSHFFLNKSRTQNYDKLTQNLNYLLIQCHCHKHLIIAIFGYKNNDFD